MNTESENDDLTFQSWSGGKDSTASIILERIHGLPKSTIIFSEVMFDKKRGISGELPEHIEWVHNTAIPRFEEWGYTVKIVRADLDYLDLFFHKKEKSKYPEHIGKRSGFFLGGMCAGNRLLKLNPIKQYYKQIKGPFVQYVGIAIDEPERLARLEGTNKVSLLAQYGYTEQMALELCRGYGLLSPMYEHTKRGGCWFCPNNGIRWFARLKTVYPDLYFELERLSHTPDMCSKNFKYNKTFAEVDAQVNEFIKRENAEKLQIRLEDFW